MTAVVDEIEAQKVIDESQTPKEELRPLISFGIDVDHCESLEKVIEAADVLECDFVTIPLVEDKLAGRFDLSLAEKLTAFLTTDVLRTGTAWNRVVVRTSSWLEVDAKDPKLRQQSIQALNEELGWVAHLSLPAVLLPPPTSSCPNYARVLLHNLSSWSGSAYWIRVPLCIDEAEDTWKHWNGLRLLCDAHVSLVVALELTPTLPSDGAIERWLAERVKVLVIPADTFLTNQRGYPVLSRRHQYVVAKFMENKVQILLTGHFEGGVRMYREYLEHLYVQYIAPPTTLNEFEAPYLDYLQAPLQPLADNLDASTYEVFEKDPVKYVQYQKAIRAALTDRCAPDQTFVVFVVGAGRGPLVRAALLAAQLAQRKIQVYALDKNPNAVVTLTALKKHEGWNDNLVKIVGGDMRVTDVPVKADILVSELLGSFGDNELSPECLDGAESMLKPGGISIPCDSTSFIAPLMSEQLWTAARKFGGADPFKKFETPARKLDDAKACFRFEHPRPDPNKSNERYQQMRFVNQMDGDAIMHGFAGYFHSTLYKDIAISIEPKSASKGMFSWFAMYWPLREPVVVGKSQEIVVDFWRRVGPRRVWFEWCVEQPIPGSIHNPEGRSYAIKS